MLIVHLGTAFKMNHRQQKRGSSSAAMGRIEVIACVHVP